MNAAAILTIVGYFFLAAKLLIQYGPKILDLIIQIYREVESWALNKGATSGILPASEEKRSGFIEKLSSILSSNGRKAPSKEKLIAMIDYAWHKENNPGQIPKDKPWRTIDSDMRLACARKAREIALAMAADSDRRTV